MVSGTFRFFIFQVCWLFVFVSVRELRLVILCTHCQYVLHTAFAESVQERGAIVHVFVPTCFFSASGTLALES